MHTFARGGYNEHSYYNNCLYKHNIFVGDY
jgi:hypothetical protein